MNILIMGASGFIGQKLSHHLSKTHDITVGGRNLDKLTKLFAGFRVITWQSLTVQILSSFDVVINLAGHNIASGRWTDRNKEKIINSRTVTTRKLSSLLLACGKQAPFLFNASAIGYYGLPKNNTLHIGKHFTEHSKSPVPATDFVSEVCQKWEGALSQLLERNHGVTICRFAIVLDTSGGTLQKLLPSFRLGAGAIISTGQQPFPWIAMEDVLAIFDRLLCMQTRPKIINFVSPTQTSQAQFASALAKALSRPLLLKLPQFLIKFLFGQMGEELLLHGQSVLPSALLDLDYPFLYKDISATLTALITRHQ